MLISLDYLVKYKLDGEDDYKVVRARPSAEKLTTQVRVDFPQDGVYNVRFQAIGIGRLVNKYV